MIRAIISVPDNHILTKGTRMKTTFIRNQLLTIVMILLGLTITGCNLEGPNKVTVQNPCDENANISGGQPNVIMFVFVI